MFAASLGDGLYEILNVPCLANGIHLRDVVRCRASADGLPRLDEIVEPSGWGTLHLIFQPEMQTEARDVLMARLVEAGGIVEHGLGVVGVALPSDTDVDAVLAMLSPAAERKELLYELEI